MFEIITFDNKEMDLTEVEFKASFVIPVYEKTSYFGYPATASVQFKSNTYNFQYKLVIPNEAAIDYHIESLIGLNLRQEFLKTFEPIYSMDSIQRAMKVMSDQVASSAFACGLLQGQLVSAGLDPKGYLNQSWVNVGYTNENLNLMTGYKAGGFVANNNARWFERRATAFSNKAIFHQEVKNPVINITYPLRRVIMDLNDNHGWTREQIADWLETLDININMKPKEEANV